MRERRSFVRIPLGLETTYQVIGEATAPRLGLSEDLSLGGLRLSEPEPLEPGSGISMNVTLPVQGPMVLRGMVAWCRPVGSNDDRRNGHYWAGIRWLEINPAARARLNAFLTERTHSQAVAVSLLRLPNGGHLFWWRIIGLGVLAFLLLLIARSF